GSHKNAPYFLSPPSSQSFVPSSLELPCHPLRCVSLDVPSDKLRVATIKAVELEFPTCLTY
ncbi:MAG: hypothetical protein V7K69_15245, partial [Nostoc sp.]|uniref:hypothetical protein n=1 Tax=Nostoc sp. TaxID=1180 RepID=UPI002FF8A1CA